VVIPVAALLVAMTMNGGGAHETLLAMERVIRDTVTTAFQFVRELF
jgi:hypothetical protein